MGAVTGCLTFRQWASGRSRSCSRQKRAAALVGLKPSDEAHNPKRKLSARH